MSGTCYANKILYVDLTAGTTRTEPLTDEVKKKYLGGQGVNLKLYAELSKPHVDALSPENPLIIGAGAFCGTSTPSSAKMTATTKYPINGNIGTSAACSFGPQLKWAGYDNIAITGASDKEVYLYISGDTVELRDATPYWGRDIVDATDALREELGRDISVICIGQAGERQLNLSLSLVDKVSTLGRGGIAAVMGSKKLKAIVVQGSPQVLNIAKPEEFKPIYDRIVETHLADPNRPTWVNHGLMGISDTWFSSGVVLADNKRKATMGEEAKERWGFDSFKETIDTAPWAPPSCITCDKSKMKVKKGKYKGLETLQAVTNEVICNFAAPLGLDIDEGTKLADVYNRLGFDFMDTINLIELMVELYEAGVITKEQLEIEPVFTVETVLEATHKMLNREGIWEICSRGIMAVEKEIPGADKYTLHQKGLMPFADGRTILGVESLGMITLPRGGNAFTLVSQPSTAIPGIPTRVIHRMAKSHYGIPEEALERIFDEEDNWDVARLLPYVENYNTAMNSVGLCFRFFISKHYNVDTIAEIYTALTGTPMTGTEFIEAGERIWNLQKALNSREGQTRKDDSFPKRWFEEPIMHGEKEKWLQDYCSDKKLGYEETEEILSRYYHERGWDVEKGVPDTEKMEQLGLAAL